MQHPEMSQEEQMNFAMEFARALQGINSYLFNPLLSNQHLKNVNLNPVDLNRSQLQQALADPKSNERTLRRYGQFLYLSQMAYQRMIHYLADVLTFDHYPIPINATATDMNTRAFKKDWDIACAWFDKFNVKKEFKRAILKMLKEDGYFTYMREDEDSLFLQEMPIDWCLIDSNWKHGYLYSFNLMYFQEAGADINGYSKDFKTYYRNMLDMKKNKTYYPNIRAEMRNGQWAYWQQINPQHGWVFKFHDDFAGLAPVFMGVFLDFLDIPLYKELLKSKSELDVYKVIMGTVPRNKDDKTGNKADNFAITAESLGHFVQLVKNSLLNKYVDFKAVPLENLEMFSFENSTDKDDVMTRALNNISSQTGVDRAVLNTDRPNVSSLALSKLVDAEFVARVYSQFEDFCTYHVNRETKKFKFQIKFEGTIHDRKERQDRALTLAQSGILTPRLAAAEGLSIKELGNGMALMKWLGYPDNLTPIQSSYTMSSSPTKPSGGRPQSDEDELEESGVQTRTIGANERDED